MIDFEELKILRRFEIEIDKLGYDFYNEQIIKVGIEKPIKIENYVILKDNIVKGRVSKQTIIRSKLYG